MITRKMATGSGHVKVGDRESQTQKQRHLHQLIDVRKTVYFFTFTVFLSPLIYHSASRITVLPLPQLSNIFAFQPLLIAAKDNTDKLEAEDGRDLARILRESSMIENKTVIVVMMNQAWAEPNSTFDVFFEGFHAGEGTEKLLRHVVLVCLDDEAYSRCNHIHPRRCFLLKTTGVDFSGEKLYMAPDYLKMMWLRTEFLGSLLKLGYNFLFTDMDTIWLRDPFPRLLAEVDFQVAGDYYNFNGNSSDLRNGANGGFNFVVSNCRTIAFYSYWYASRLRFPGKNERVVLERIKQDNFVKEIGLTMRFLDPVYFGNFCQPGWDISKVCLMHGTCCSGKGNKVNDLRQVLEDWRNYMLAEASGKYGSRKLGFRRLKSCRRRRGRRH
ncbi:hypothetical protein IGI04_026284 [Brassica rapa subsp. trilocularis]|uniref:Nucleotide-diphospho-sugar transferase domain-containing protein n=1 Tax=Brassica rapa subsp. trilocularis TaxID=1813537 RepID=A0ABQ7KVK2_BRACM|nr:hypothetical protein IGI04_026284 [Brassica rapa subsp. trilocularis]